MPKSSRDCPLRILLEAPPRGVLFALQRGKAELAAAALSTGADVRFDLVIGCRLEQGGVDFTGPYAQGPRGARFVYVNVGALAGQTGSSIRKRIKIQLGGITAGQIEAALASPGQVLCARIAGTARDGGPPAATVPILGGWVLADA